MADEKTSKHYQETIADIEIENFEFADGLKDLVRKHQATSKVAYAKAGRELHKSQIKGGEGKGKAFAIRNDRWKLICESIIAKHPAKNNSEIARLMPKEIAKVNHPDDETGRTLNHRTLRRLVGEWRSPQIKP